MNADVNVHVPPNYASLPAHEEAFFKMIEHNMLMFSGMSMTPAGHMQKLAMLSSILRSHNIEQLNVPMVFIATCGNQWLEKYECTIVVEPHNSDHIVHKPRIMQMIEVLEQKIQDMDPEEKDPSQGRLYTLVQQQDKVKALFNDMTQRLHGDHNAGLAVTSLLLFEMEKLSSTKASDILIFQDMYDPQNLLDQWFACLHVHADFSQPIGFVANDFTAVQ